MPKNNKKLASSEVPQNGTKEGRKLKNYCELKDYEH